MNTLSSFDDTTAVNAYGSHLDANDSNGASSESSTDAETTVEEREYCECNGKCFRKKGKGACKCRLNGLLCNDSCSCKKTKCRNMNEPEDELVNARQVVPDGNEAFQHEVLESKAEIEEFVSNLENYAKDRILVNLLSMGRGSLDFAKTLASDPDPEPSQEPNKPEWCKCGICKPMPNEQEDVCCKRVTCVTCYTAFSNICLDRDILEVCIKARCDIQADDFNFSMESFRKAGYRQFALWRYGKLGRGNRRVLPACAIRRIRERYPAPDGQYMGFRLH